MGQFWTSVNDVLDYAIGEGQKAVFTYRAFAREADSAEMRRIFSGLVADEVAHFKKLLKLRKASTFTVTDGSLGGLKPRPVKLPPGHLREPAAAYRFALQTEKSACELYTMLSQMAKEPEIRQVFETLAAAEQGHRAKLENELEQGKSAIGFLKGLLHLPFSLRR